MGQAEDSEGRDIRTGKQIMSTDGFSCFVGIDWSGAKGRAHKGISVFMADDNNNVPQKVMPPEGRHWSRMQLLSWLVELSREKRVLAGIDFAFSYPFCDEQAYFPGYHDSPETAPQLWAMIDRLNASQEDLYGGGIWDHDSLGAYYNAPSGRKGRLFTSRRRLTEHHARAVKAPSPTFNCVGPAGVGTGSLAGMRFLHHLAGRADIWPFMAVGRHNLAVVEIFPSYYFAQAGIRAVNGAHSDVENINKALRHFGSDPVPSGFVAEGPDADDADALISAAALRAGQGCLMSCPQPESSKLEGWIFGVS